MKNSVLAVFSLISFVSLQTGANAATNVVNQLLPNILDHVSECSVQPFTLDANGVKTYHSLVSHCSDVKVVSQTIATIQVEGYTFQATIVDSADSDGGDLNDVTIQEVQSGDAQTFQNVLSYDDVLLGVLGGDTSHVTEKQVTSARK